jgi:hypothetical protein
MASLSDDSLRYVYSSYPWGLDECTFSWAIHLVSQSQSIWDDLVWWTWSKLCKDRSYWVRQLLVVSLRDTCWDAQISLIVALFCDMACSFSFYVIYLPHSALCSILVMIGRSNAHCRQWSCIDAQEDDAFNYPEGLVLVQRANDENSVVVGPHIRGSRLRSSAAGFGEVDLLLPGTARWGSFLLFGLSCNTIGRVQIACCATFNITNWTVPFAGSRSS